MKSIDCRNYDKLWIILKSHSTSEEKIKVFIIKQKMKILSHSKLEKRRLWQQKKTIISSVEQIIFNSQSFEEIIFVILIFKKKQPSKDVDYFITRIIIRVSVINEITLWLFEEKKRIFLKISECNNVEYLSVDVMAKYCGLLGFQKDARYVDFIV